MLRLGENRTNRERIAKNLGLSVVIAACISCSGPVEEVVAPKSTQQTRLASPSNPRSAWYDPAATEHDFGLVLAGTDVKRTHTFRLANTSGRRVRILEVINRKPCCGIVGPIAPTTLEPGRAVDVAVTLHIGLAAGRVVHLAEVQFEGDGGNVLTAGLRTMGTGLARAVVEQFEPTPLSLEPGGSAEVGLVARSFGNRDRPPFPLVDDAIRTEARFRWKDVASSRFDPDTGLDEIRRPLVVTLTATGEPGQRLDLIELLDEGSSVARKSVAWEVSPAIRATPSGLIASADSGGPWKIVLQSRGGHPFRVVSGRSTVEGLTLSLGDGDVRASHVLDVRLIDLPRTAARSGEIVVATDHPHQPLVKVAFYIPSRRRDDVKSNTPMEPSR